MSCESPPSRREKTPSEIRKVTAYRLRSALPECIVTQFDTNCNLILRNKKLQTIGLQLIFYSAKRKLSSSSVLEKSGTTTLAPAASSFSRLMGLIPYFFCSSVATATA